MSDQSSDSWEFDDESSENCETNDCVQMASNNDRNDQKSSDKNDDLPLVLTQGQQYRAVLDFLRRCVVQLMKGLAGCDAYLETLKARSHPIALDKDERNTTGVAAFFEHIAKLFEATKNGASGDTISGSTNGYFRSSDLLPSYADLWMRLPNVAYARSELNPSYARPRRCELVIESNWIGYNMFCPCCYRMSQLTLMDKSDLGLTDCKKEDKWATLSKKGDQKPYRGELATPLTQELINRSLHWRRKVIEEEPVSIHHPKIEKRRNLWNDFGITKQIENDASTTGNVTTGNSNEASATTEKTNAAIIPETFEMSILEIVSKYESGLPEFEEEKDDKKKFRNSNEKHVDPYRLKYTLEEWMDFLYMKELFHLTHWKRLKAWRNGNRDPVLTKALQPWESNVNKGKDILDLSILENYTAVGSGDAVVKGHAKKGEAGVEKAKEESDGPTATNSTASSVTSSRTTSITAASSFSSIREGLGVIGESAKNKESDAQQEDDQSADFEKEKEEDFSEDELDTGVASDENKKSVWAKGGSHAWFEIDLSSLSKDGKREYYRSVLKKRLENDADSWKEWFDWFNKDEDEKKNWFENDGDEDVAKSKNDSSDETGNSKDEAVSEAEQKKDSNEDADEKSDSIANDESPRIIVPLNSLSKERLDQWRNGKGDFALDQKDKNLEWYAEKLLKTHEKKMDKFRIDHIDSVKKKRRDENRATLRRLSDCVKEDMEEPLREGNDEKNDEGKSTPANSMKSYRASSRRGSIDLEEPCFTVLQTESFRDREEVRIKVEDGIYAWITIYEAELKIEWWEQEPPVGTELRQNCGLFKNRFLIEKDYKPYDHHINYDAYYKNSNVSPNCSSTPKTVTPNVTPSKKDHGSPFRSSSERVKTDGISLFAGDRDQDYGLAKPKKIVYDDDTEEEPDDTKPARENQATKKKPTKCSYVIFLWGGTIEYTLGALVLGKSLKMTDTPHDLVCLHTPDVPELKTLRKYWKTICIEHIPVTTKYFGGKDGWRASRFQHVFSKLHCFSLIQYRKVLCLDIDMIVTQNIDNLFDLAAPAAMRRGANNNGAMEHGYRCDGDAFFCGHVEGEKLDNPHQSSWFQGTGINAGLMLFEPNKAVLKDHKAVVSSLNHPEHIQGTGPEQDYLSRYFADAPWTHISVEYNYQLHQIFHNLNPLGRAERKHYLDKEKRKEIKVLHYSGALKPWHHVLREDLQSKSIDEFVQEELDGFDTYNLWYHRQGWEDQTREDAYSVAYYRGMLWDKSDWRRLDEKDLEFRCEQAIMIVRSAHLMWLNVWKQIYENEFDERQKRVFRKLVLPSAHIVEDKTNKESLKKTDQERDFSKEKVDEAEYEIDNEIVDSEIIKTAENKLGLSEHVNEKDQIPSTVDCNVSTNLSNVSVDSNVSTSAIDSTVSGTIQTEPSPLSSNPISSIKASPAAEDGDVKCSPMIATESP